MSTAYQRANNGFCWLLHTVFLASPISARAQTYRVACEGFEGVRVQFSGNVAGPKDQLNKLIRGLDVITGLRLEITFSLGSNTASVTTYGNVNSRGTIETYSLARVKTEDYISFVGLNGKDHSINVFSYYPALRRLMWTIHTDRIFIVDKVALGKTYSAACSSAVL